MSPHLQPQPLCSIHDLQGGPSKCNRARGQMFTPVCEPGPATACVHHLGWPLCWRLTAACGGQALIWDKKFKPYVMEYAADEEKFFKVRSCRGLRAASVGTRRPLSLQCMQACIATCRRQALFIQVFVLLSLSMTLSIPLFPHLASPAGSNQCQCPPAGTPRLASRWSWTCQRRPF